MEISMTAKETAAMIKWLKEHGHSSDEAVECVEYIAQNT